MARSARNRPSNGVKGKGRKRSKAEIRAHRIRIFELVMMGKTCEEAGEIVGIAKVTAWRDYVAECQRRATDEEIEVRRQTILAGLDRIMMKALARMDDNPEKAGETFMKATDRLIRMLGLEAEKKVAMKVTGRVLMDEKEWADLLSRARDEPD